MANDHKATVLNDKTFRQLFSPEERENLHPIKFAGGNTRMKNTFKFIHGSDELLKVFTSNHGVITCKKIDKAKGPF